MRPKTSFTPRNIGPKSPTGTLSLKSRAPGWNKYGAKKTTVDNIVFASKAEASYYLTDIKPRVLVGEISELEFHKTFRLEVAGKLIGKYTPDFVFRESGQVVAVEVKGAESRDFRLRAKLFLALYPEIELRIVK